MSAETAPLLSVQHLAVRYPSRRRSLFDPKRPPFVAVDDVSFDVMPGETVALVGESGSGKTTIGNAVLGLVPTATGRIELAGTEITHADTARRRQLANDLQVIFQNPYGSLNPSLTVEQILTEPLRVLQKTTAGESRSLVRELLDRVGLPADAASRFPGNFSGGQRQRIAIARAIAVRPKIIVCDEPTSALDVSTQQVVLNLLDELQRDTGVSYLFITHDLAVVRRFADRVAVLDHGRIIEFGTAEQICEQPEHPYTQRLVAAAPVPDPIVQRERRAARLAASK